MKLESFTFSFLCPHIYVKKNENIFIAQEKKKTTKTHTPQKHLPERIGFPFSILQKDLFP